jgi:hypothetical protein
MNHPNIFSLNNENEGVSSTYVPFISFSSHERKDLAESYILREADYFFKSILKIDIPIASIPYYKNITPQDFNQVEMQYFYNTLFFDLGERDSRGKLVNKLKWGVTFDEAAAPIQVAYLNPSFSDSHEEAKLSYSDFNVSRPLLSYRLSNSATLYRKYGFISLNGVPVFYYLHFTLQEVLDAIK